MNLNSTTLGQCWLPKTGCRWLLMVKEADQNRQVALKVEAVFPGREMERRVLTAGVDAEVGAHNLCLEWGRPDDQCALRCEG